tara:strand:+ start:165 stop:593 length:429 start_codon:yes stop_codon:yes gene_type:complete
MSIKISIKKNINNKDIKNCVLFCEKNFKINTIKKEITNAEFSYIAGLLKNSDLKKNIYSFDISSNRKIILINNKDQLNSSDVEKLGAELYDFIKVNKIKNLAINSNSLNAKHGKDFVGRFLHGLKLKSYEFLKYKTKKKQLM